MKGKASQATLTTSGQVAPGSGTLLWSVSLFGTRSCTHVENFWSVLSANASMHPLPTCCHVRSIQVTLFWFGLCHCQLEEGDRHRKENTKNWCARTCVCVGLFVSVSVGLFASVERSVGCSPPPSPPQCFVSLSLHLTQQF